MARNYSQGQFQPKNKEKYIGTWPIVYRSSWELVLMQKFDLHPNITQWASESIHIKYYNPFLQKITTYIPDFLVIYVDKNGKSFKELIEIKPLKQTIMEKAKTKEAKAAVILNMAKWDAARKWCKNNGFGFRVMTEKDMFLQVTKAKK